MALKLDMRKAYDQVEWDFLDKLMLRMGFNEIWVGLIMTCVKIMTYSVMVNGEPKRLITPSRGIRQWDPLSHFLFLLCNKGFHSLFQHAASSREITGFAFCTRGPKLTHLFFADDSLLFCRATPRECDTVMELLSKYESVFGQKANRNKTTFFFSESVNEASRQIIKDILGVREEHHYEEYLGFPSLIGRSKKASFNYIEERVWRKLQGWEGRS